MTNEQSRPLDKRLIRIIIWAAIVAALYFLARTGIDKAFVWGTLTFLGVVACGLVP